MKNFLIISTVTVACLACVATAKVVKIELPVETATYKTAPGSDVANAQCLTCHSADYAAMQPPKPREFWVAEVGKMKGKYAAPIPDEQTNSLIAYFSKNYGTDTTTEGTTVQFDTTMLEPQSLATKMGCLNCHNTDKKVIGPAYRDVAAKYAKDPKAMDRVREQITHGGSGKWGTVPMPAYTIMSDAQVESLARWVLSQKQ